jgi:hypoxanthine phosphoribosyltransferase
VDIPSLTLRDIDNLAIDLGERITSLKYSPTHILYIDRAGQYIGLKLAEFFRCGCSGISASREGNRLKEILRPFLKLLPEWTTHYLRKVELKSGVHVANKERHVRFLNEPPAIEAFIVVVDDAVDSGYSMYSVLRFMESMGYDKRRILTAAITVTGKQRVHQPDVCIYDHLITFPWSVGSKYYDEYLRVEKRIAST